MRKVPALLIALLCLGLAACDTAVNVDATSNVTASYSSVLVTVKEVWINESATAGPDDATWVKFPLEEPQTLELVTATSGTLKQLATDLALPAGTYHQMRLFLADRSESLTDSANSASATYNDQVTYIDIDGNSITLPLELANPAQGIGIEMELKVPAASDAILAALAGSSSTTSTTTTTTNNLTDTTDTSTDTSTPTRTPAATLSDTNSVTATANIVFDAARDLTAFSFSDQRGFLLNPTLKAYDPKSVGSIQGQLDLSLIPFASSGSGKPEIQVTAEDLNEDSTRREIVASAPVKADGTFVLYPLPLKTDKRTSTTYDLVIHGPEVRTIIIRTVPVTSGTPSSGANIALGTLTLDPADSYAVNLAADSSVSERGARVGFYQSLPDDDVPYLIELRPVDPLSGQFAADELVSGSSTLVYGTYASSFSLVAAEPQEGASRYAVAAVDPLYGDGDYSATLLTPPALSSNVATFTVPAIAIPETAAAGTIAATIAVATAGKYDKGAVVITHNGAVVAAAPLDDALAAGGASTVVNITNVPASTTAGFDKGLYYAETWAWNSADPVNTFTRQAGTAAIDLRTTLTTTASLTLN